ncbi:MAG: hypothetical protein M1826_006376 [Phylliscum demangeonii]|nr:MAG: hypothetical protein M1826_006376 [Phylliscum demangeonii]
MPRRERNVFVVDAGGAHTGGFFQNGSVTNATFHEMLEMAFIINRPWELHRWRADQTAELVPNDRASGVRVYAGADGSAEPFEDDFVGFQAAHVYPRAYEQLFEQEGLRRCVVEDDEEFPLDPSTSAVDSVRNGLLLAATHHQRFDTYRWSVNVNDGYKIVSFFPDIFGIDGRVLAPSCRDRTDPRSVPDEFFRWHFRQAVLANVTGAGEPIWDFDNPPDSDVMECIRNGPEPEKRMEMELVTRLRVLI